MKVEFVSYSGKWPCLCMGELTLKIDDKIVTFGSLSEQKKDYWIEIISGGSCGFTDNSYTDSFITEGEWDIILPDEFKSIEKEVKKLFNENVPYGCCGGCL